MLWLILTLALVFAGLTVFFWVGSLFIQGYFYETSSADLHWRAPAAAGAVTLFIAFFCLLAKKYEVNTLFEFTSADETKFDQFDSIRNGKETHYIKDKSKGKFVEVQDRNRGWEWNTSEGVVDSLIVKEGDQRTVFKADLTPEGRPKDGGKIVRFVEEGGKGRFITTDPFGVITTPRPGLTLLVLLINFLHFLVWFLAIWLLLEYQWPHALLLALPFWAAMTLIALPGMVDRLRM
ncbi:MAG: hypothetical protein ACJ8FY_28420 [Gemmataceae bacterium]